MDTNKQIKLQKQLVARSEKTLALAKLKKRKADTRRKIELGGLVIKAGMAGYCKSVILGSLISAMNDIQKNDGHTAYFEAIGKMSFLNQNE